MLSESYGNNLEEAENKALELSAKNPAEYYIIVNCFGACIESHKHLGVFAPSDSISQFYFKNGKRKMFTQSQKIQDQIQTPTMQ
jgi:hypothetical protein